MRVTFTDDTGRTRSVETSTSLAVDLTGDWTGAVPIMAGRASGRCFGTIAGTFELQRAA